MSDIKKLKKENEMLKKGLWYLRDEYDKLEKLIKDKKLDFSSSSTTGSTSSDSVTYISTRINLMVYLYLIDFYLTKFFVGKLQLL